MASYCIRMDREKFSAIAHRTHRHCNPISNEKIERVLDVLSLGPQSKAVDYGCGKAELLIRLIEKFQLTADGIDLSARMIAEARDRARNRIDLAKLRLHEMPGAKFWNVDKIYDLALCIGSSHVFGDLEKTIVALRAQVKPRGYVLVADAYWKQTPAPEYLEALGASESDYRTHAGNVALGEEAGLIPLYAATASEDDWDDYEWRYSRSVEEYIRDNPADPDGEEMLLRIRRWRKLYLEHGRGTLGFGIYLFSVK